MKQSIKQILDVILYEKKTLLLSILLALAIFLLIVLASFAYRTAVVMRHGPFPGRGDMLPGQGMPRPGFGGMGPDKRLFDRFCNSGMVTDKPGFVQKFKPGIDKRLQKISFVKDHLEEIISDIKSQSKDVSNLEKYLQTISGMISDFQSGSQDFQMSPEHFCEGEKERREFNIKLKSIMTGIAEEMGKI